MACDVTQGACCYLDAMSNQVTCAVTTMDDCVNTLGGTYAGDGTVCGSGMGEVTCNACVADIDNDGDVDLGDFGLFGAAFNSMVGDPNYNPDADLDNMGAGDGDVDLGDFGIFGAEFNRSDCLQVVVN